MLWRLCGVWNVLSSRLLGINNTHARRHPLRVKDPNLYRRVKARRYTLGNERIEKQKRVQKTMAEAQG